MEASLKVHTPAPVPRNTTDWVRKFEASKTLNDAVETIHSKLMSGAQSEQYFKFLDAIHDSQAVEGSLAADNFSASLLIREHARKNGDVLVSRQNLDVINKALGVVLRRYGLSRKERRNTVGGKIVMPENGE